MKYIATIAGQEHTVAIGSDDQITLDGTPCAAYLESIDGDALFSLLLYNGFHEVFVERRGSRYYVVVEGSRYEVLVEDELARRARGPRITTRQGGERTPVTSPMPGIVVAVLAQEGQPIRAGDGVAILEAMKMENEIRAPHDGVVQSIHVTPGQTVNQNEVMATIGATDEPSA